MDTEPTSPILVVLITAPDAKTAETLAHALVSERLVACVNVLPGVRSVYRWQGEVQTEGEVLCLCKTRPERFEQLRARVVEVHPYDVPEIVALPVVQALSAYADWVAASTD